jgi:lipopolysaccharide heptosyltransferase II
MRILIIKLGALGDVLRTTTLLRVLKGRVCWITAAKSALLLSGNPLLDRLLLIENLEPTVLEEEFDLVFNLEDDRSAANLATRVKKKQMIGAYLDDDGIAYTDSSREWFDMSMSSRFGKDRADRLKMNNSKTYQEMIFAMLQQPFRGEEYFLNARLTKPSVAGRVGLECRAGEVWPM